MSERTTPPLSPQDILRLKDGILDQWKQLSTEHQAIMALVLLRQLIESEYGSWTLAAIEMLWKEKSPPYSKLLPIHPLTLADLQQTDLTADEIAQLTEDDLKHITHEMSEHYTNDVFWEELEFVARLILEEKRRR